MRYKSGLLKPILIILLITNCQFAYNVSAKVLEIKDSLNKESFIQFGFGGYIGTHIIRPITAGFDYNNSQAKTENGIDQGVFFKLVTNINSNISFELDAKIQQQSSTIGFFKGGALYYFNFIRNGWQIPLYLNYKLTNSKKKEIVGIALGASYGNYYYKTYNETIVLPQIIPSDGTSGAFLLNNSKEKMYTYLINVNKTFRISKELSLVVFNEFEIFGKDLKVENGLNQKYNLDTYYNQYNFRLGLYIKYL